MLFTKRVPESVPIHIWFESDNGPQFLCAVEPEEVLAAVSDRRVHEFPMDMVCAECLRAFASKRLHVQFHITLGSDSGALCGAREPEYLVDGKYSDGLTAEDWCPACRAEWETRKVQG